jgi:integrase
MARIVQEGAVWRVQIKKIGVRDSGTFPTKIAASNWATQREAEIMAKKTGKAPPGATFNDILQRYKEEVSPTKVSGDKDAARVDYIQRTQKKICRTKVEALSASDFAAWRDGRRKTVLDSTVLREWSILTHAIRLACTEWGWMTENPMKTLAQPEPAAPRTRRPSAEEIEKLLAGFNYDPEVPPTNKTECVGWCFVFAIETAMRSKEIVTLKWQDVHIDQRIVSLPIQTEGKRKGKADTKTGKARDIPLSTRAIAVLEMMQSIKEEGDEFVFKLTTGTRDMLFRRIRDRLGIKNLHFHDARAEALTRMAKKVPLVSLARISGHANVNQLMTYYRETPTEIAAMLG